MSRRRRSGAKQGVPDESVEDGPPVQAAAVMRGDGGHALVFLELPRSVVAKYAVATEQPELRAIVAGKLVQWVEGQP